MSDPLDDFNKRMTAGSGSWRMGPPTNAAESAAQSFIDAQQPRTGATGGGSIDFGIRPGAIILIIGIVLYAAGGYLVDNFQETTAMTGMLILIVSGFSFLIGGGGLVVGCLKSLGSAGGWRNLLLAILTGLVVWWLSPWLWVMGLTIVPGELVALAAVALVFVLTGRH